MNATPNNALQRTRVRPAGGRSPLSFETFGDKAQMKSRKALYLASFLAALGTVVLAVPQKPKPSPWPHSVVEAVVNEKGKVESARIVESGGAELDRQALELVKGRSYKPVLKDGKAVKAFLTVTIMPHPDL